MRHLRTILFFAAALLMAFAALVNATISVPHLHEDMVEINVRPTLLGAVSLGRHKKRTLRSLVWKLKKPELSAAEIAHLRGWISYVRSVEPDFVARLQRKYDLDFSLNATWDLE